jgi:hypothetical protein
MSTTVERESKMIPIKIPVYGGLLGLRLLFGRDIMQNKLMSIQTLSDLQKFTGVHGLHLGDLPVYAENKLPVKPEVSYKHMFILLKKGRVDYFHRGLVEIWDEQRLNASSLSVVNNLMLFYSHPVYFFVSKHRPKLVKSLEDGLKIAIADGSLKAIFLEEYGEILKKAKLESRKLINLKNLVIPKNKPELDTSWSAPKEHSYLLK